MPIFTFFAVVGSALTALLFVTDLTLEKSETPVVVSSSFYGMPKPWKPDPEAPVLVATPAPEPDMKSDAVLAAAPKTADAKTAAANPAMSAMAHAPKVEAPKKKRVVHKQPHDGRQNFASTRNGNDFFGGGFFGRF